MPIVDVALIAAVRAQIDTEFGAIPSDLHFDANDYRERLARCIARAAQYTRDNAQVNVGQSVTVPALGLIDSTTNPVTGTATGTVVTTGTIS